MRAALGAALAIGVCLFAAACGDGGAAQVTSHASPSDKWATAGRVVVDGAGRIIAARRGYPQPGALFAVSRFTRSGSLDQSFGTGGTAVADFGSKYGAGAAAVAVQRDGKIVAFGWSASGPPDPHEGVGPAFVIARFLPDGQLDPGFGTGGKVVPRLTGDFSAGAVRPDGRIVVLAPQLDFGGDVTGAQLVRYRPDGQLDRSFGAGGKLELGSMAGYDLGRPLFGSDGKLLLSEGPASYADYSHGTPKGRLTRYQPEGQLDGSFGDGGTAVIHGSLPYSPMAVQGDGKILAGGGGGPGGDDWAVARYRPNGRPDLSFGSGASAVTNFGPRYTDYPSAIAVQDDGKIVAGGSHLPATSGDPTHEFLVLVRYTPDGQLDPGFGDGGKVVDKRQGGPVDGLIIQSDGRIVVSASRSPSLFGGATSGSILSRYTADGKLDKSFGDGGTVAIDAPNG